MPRVYTRKFDWDEALRLHEEGLTKAEIADRLGVTPSAVYFAISPERRAEQVVRLKKWTKLGRCDDCGGQMSNASRSRGSRRCKSCAAVARRTNIRFDTLLCLGCKEWLSDKSFPHNRQNVARRFRHNFCGACNAKARRDYRDRHKVPCAAGCGTLVMSPSEQESQARSKGHTTRYMCRGCTSRARYAEMRLLESNGAPT